MTFHCSVCQEKLETINETCSHLRRIHGLFDGKILQLKCCAKACEKIFKNYSSFREHLKNHLIFESNPLGLCNSDASHKRPGQRDPSDNCFQPLKVIKTSDSSRSQLNFSDKSVAKEPVMPESLPSTSNTNVNLDTAAIKPVITEALPSTSNTTVNLKPEVLQPENCNEKENLFQRFIMNLDSTSMPKTTLDKIVIEASRLLDTVFDDISDLFSNSPSSFYGNFKDYVSNQRKTYAAVSSSYKRNKIISEEENMISPKYITIGTRQTEVYDKETGVYKSIPVQCKVAYVPILETVRFVLANKSVMQEIKKDFEDKSELITSFRDGLYYQRHILFKINKCNIALLFYFDEFETVNPLGSKTGGHKLGAIYCTFRNLPNEFNAILENIMLVALFYSADVKTCGMSNILQSLIDDLKLFENKGITIGNDVIRGTIAAFAFDNLGGNMIYGLPQSFNKTYYCRICTVSYEEAKTMLLEKEEYLRSEILNPRCEDNNFSRTVGCKNESFFSELKYFDSFHCLSVDIAHDFLEGIAQGEVKLFLKELIENRKIIKLEKLNERIKIFNYGINESKNKPSPIVLTKQSNLIGQRAAQTRCLCQFLPLIISDVLKEACDKSDPIWKKWQVVMLLLKMMQIVFSPILTKAMVAELKELIVEHHSLFLQHLGDHLLPKHHFLLHYPLVMKMMGPLIFLWTLRFEGKHYYFKDLMNHIKNFINIIKTLSEQHQKFIYEKWCNSDKKVEQCVTAKTGRYVELVKHITKHGIDKNVVVNFPRFVYLVQKLTFRVEYRVGHFIAIKEDSTEFPSFYKIASLFIACNCAYAICELYKTVEFDEIYLGYKVTPIESTAKIIYNLKNLSHIISYELHQPYHTKDFYIIPKYRII